MLSFDSSSFAIAGAIAAAGPILIHLLNQRRFKTVSWAAMDFLREAIKRQRRMLEIRDFLLLVLRMLVVVLFGFALARPYYNGSTVGVLWQTGLLAFCLLTAMTLAIAWVMSPKRRARGPVALFPVLILLTLAIPVYFAFQQSSPGDDSAMNARMPVHAVLVVDNSRSMGVEMVGANLLDRAKEKAIEFIEMLPPESRMTVIPLAGSEEAFTLDAYRTRDDARRVLERIKLVDTEGTVRTGLEQAEQACRQTTDLRTKRVVLLTDLQANAWKSTVPPDLLKRLSGLQIVDLTSAGAQNLWISGLHIEDGLTSAETPCRILARLHASPPDTDARSIKDDTFEVQIKLQIDGTEVDSQVIELSAGQEREIAFTHHFEQPADPLHPGSAVVTVSLQSAQTAADRLLVDNQQQIVVPIVASLPVIFVDQFGSSENLEAGRIGETNALRHLMSPHTSNDSSQRRLIHVGHIRFDQISQELLETARLVVVAGVEQPDEAGVSVLRDYVQQGGPMVILAGGQFNPAQWTERAWLGGRGILPAPLNAKPFRYVPEESAQLLQPFHAAFATMQHDFFLIEGEDPKALSLLFESTPFFKAVQAELNSTVMAELSQADALRQSAARSETDRVGEISQHPEPMWWNWRSALSGTDHSLTLDEQARQRQPRVLAMYDIDNLAFVIERRIGDGRVVLFTSGVSSNWNLLRSSGAMYLFHRTFCQLMEGTLPIRNFRAGQKITIPVEQQSSNRFSVERPSGVREPVNLDAVSGRAHAISIRRPLLAGTYAIRATPAEPGATDDELRSSDTLTLAVNGAESESDLSVIAPGELQQKLGQIDVRVLTSDEQIRIEGGAQRGQDLWKTIAACVLGCLLLEKLVLVWPALTKQFRKSQPPEFPICS